jgi:hypothetical protein
MKNVQSFAFVSKFTPAMIDAEIREMPTRFTESKSPEVAPAIAAVEADEPPPIPEDALGNVLDLSTMRTQAGERVSQMVNEERMRGVFQSPRPRRRGGFRRSNNQEPRIIQARFPGKCAELETDIETGERILWKPGSRLVYSENSERFQEFERNQQ